MSVCYEVSGAKMAAPASQTSQDKMDVYNLEKLIKFFTLKSAQIIVQARSGGKVETKCNADSTEKDWFNLAIKDIPEVVTEAKKAMGSSGPRLPLCVEISLRTNDQETMTLETWCIGVRKDVVDPTMGVTHSLYIRLGILLKSLVTLTRVTPAYKLSRKKSDYVICYRIYVGEPQLYSLGKGYTQMNVGQVATSLGTLHMSVAYRTKLTISPQHTKSSCMMVKSDHFRPDSSPADNYVKNCADMKSSLCDQPVKIGAFADKPKPIEPEPVDIPFSNLVTCSPPTCSPQTYLPQMYPDVKVPAPSSTATVDSSSGGGSVGSAGAGGRTNDNASLNTADSDNGNVTPHSDEPFVLLDLKTPFAGSNANTELSMFYRECMRAPQLQTFTEETVEEQIGDLTKQLEVFETSLQEYDNILTSVCHSENNN